MKEASTLPHSLHLFWYIYIVLPDLLYLHRSFFAVALRDDPNNPLEHRFGPSVVASYRSARRMCVALRGLYLVHAEPLSRFWYFWSCIFSSCVSFYDGC